MATSNAIWNEKTRAEWRKRAELERAERGMEGAVSCHVFLRALDTCDGLDAKVAKATKMWTGDMLHAGKELMSVKSANKRQREENRKLKQLLAAVLGDEAATYSTADRIEDMLSDRVDGFTERHAALIESMFGDAFVEVSDGES